MKTKPLANLFGKLTVVVTYLAMIPAVVAAQNVRLDYQSLPDLPDPIGVAGPLVGVSNDVLIVAGGANFAPPEAPELWDLPKKYLDQVWVLERDADTDSFSWRDDREAFRLTQPVAYSAVVSTRDGVLCMGGEDSEGPVNRTFLLKYAAEGPGDARQLIENDAVVPDLPMACTGGSAAVVGGYVYLVAGQVVDEAGNRAASRMVWRWKLDRLDQPVDPASDSAAAVETDRWEQVVAWPETGPRRMFPLVAAQHDGFTQRLFVFGGRRFLTGQPPTDASLVFSKDGWSFDPTNYQPEKFDAVSGNYDGPSPWKAIADAPVPLAAGTSIACGPAHVLVLGYATGDVLKQQLDSGVAMKDFAHPGFPKQAYAYHTITDTWTEFGAIPVNSVTTPAVSWEDEIFLVSGEIRPRVRTNRVWRIEVVPQAADFGPINMAVVVVYLLGMVGVGVFFTYRNKTTDDYFRGGKSIALVGRRVQHFCHDAQFDYLHGHPGQGICPGLGLFRR